MIMVYYSPLLLTALDLEGDTRTREATEEVIRRSLALIERSPATLRAMVIDRDQQTKP